HAGSGLEQLRDGPLQNAALNQPSGLAANGEHLFVADSEASAIRMADLEPGGHLNTLVGTGLFEFGDVDGVGRAAKLQHPLGLALSGDDLYIADTYNHRIKRLNLRNSQVSSVAGDGTPGADDGAAAE